MAAGEAPFRNDASEASDPYERAAQTFPQLPEEMAERLAGYGEVEAIAAGTCLFERGDRAVDFFLVIEGSVEVLDRDARGRASVVTRHGPRQFTGELDLFNDRAIIVSARAASDSRVVRIRREDFRRMIATEADIGEIIMRAFILRRVGLIQHTQGAVTLIGSLHGSDTLRIEAFLTRNGFPHRTLDIDTDPDAGGFMQCFGLEPGQLPVVILQGHALLRNPETSRLADAMGVTEAFDPDHVYDVAVVGAGPAGLAAAVYAASEGLATIVIEAVAPGGQAGTSSKIENYLGFPTGISGQALAGRAQVQAQKFGARLAISRAATGIDCSGTPFRVRVEDGGVVSACAVVVATGARYRKLDVPGYGRFEGQGILYAATAMEAQLCADQEVVVVGGGNSAGQAAVYLSRTSRHVHILVRADGLADSMSDYLVQRIDSSPRITLHPHCAVTALEGDDYLRRLTWTDRATGESETREVGGLFVMIGAEPNTGWLDGCLMLDDKGFVVTGRDPDGRALASPYAASRAGIFAVGDVRSGSIKRVASGVGEGSVVVSAIHRFLTPGVA